MAFDRFVLKKLLVPYIWRRIFRERLTEPLHLNIIAVFVALFGTYRAKIDFDLVIRHHHAFGLLKAADYARAVGLPALTAIEFGVANGAGLLNMCNIADRITRITGVRFNIVGFDLGSGMPAPIDYRDHPEHYHVGDYPMQDPEALVRRLPANATVRFGPLRETVPAFLRETRHPIGFISIDVDYYSSTVDALQILTGPPEIYLRLIPIYVDDMNWDDHSVYAGELLAIREFNDEHALRKITKFNMLREQRIFQRAIWIEQMFTAHIFDHPSRAAALTQVGTAVLTNPYL